MHYLWSKLIHIWNTNLKIMAPHICVDMMDIWHALSDLWPYTQRGSDKFPVTKLSDYYSSHQSKVLFRELRRWYRMAVSKELMRFTGSISGQLPHWANSGANQALWWVKSQFCKSQSLEQGGMEASQRNASILSESLSNFIKSQLNTLTNSKRRNLINLFAPYQFSSQERDSM